MAKGYFSAPFSSQMDYRHESNRLQTFSGWPSDSRQSPHVLAAEGFIYKGHEDYVECFFCGISFFRWNQNCDPGKLHFEKTDGKCSFINRKMDLRKKTGLWSTSLDRDGFTDCINHSTTGGLSVVYVRKRSRIGENTAESDNVTHLQHFSEPPLAPNRSNRSNVDRLGDTSTDIMQQRGERDCENHSRRRVTSAEQLFMTDTCHSSSDIGGGISHISEKNKPFIRKDANTLPMGLKDKHQSESRPDYFAESDADISITEPETAALGDRVPSMLVLSPTTSIESSLDAKIPLRYYVNAVMDKDIVQLVIEKGHSVDLVKAVVKKKLEESGHMYTSAADLVKDIHQFEAEN